jgi:hypothetical protein
LIDLDQVWAPSYGELADAHRHFGHVAEAAELYAQAASLGPPYVGHHLLRAASCAEEAGQPELALSCLGGGRPGGR